MPIITTTQLRAFTRNTLAEVDESFITMARDAAELLIRGATGRDFDVAGAPTTRVFRPRPNATRLTIPDAASITSVVEDGVTLVAGTDYVAEPLNSIALDGTDRPIEWLSRIDHYWYRYDLRSTISVNAAWGWATIPSDISEAALLISKDIIRHRDVVSGIEGFLDMAAIRIRNAPLVDAIQQKYQRVKFA